VAAVFFHCYAHLRDLHSFPTRRSSDLRSPVRMNSPSISLSSALRLSPCMTRILTAVWSSRLVVKIFARAVGTVVFCGISSSKLRSEEHTSELQSRENLVCRLLLEKKNI